MLDLLRNPSQESGARLLSLRPENSRRVMKNCFWLLFTTLSLLIQTAQAERTELRVGLVAFRADARDLFAADQFFARLQETLGADFQIRVTVGTQKDVLNWAEQRKIDFALLSPLAFGQLLSRSSLSGKEPWVYLLSGKKHSLGFPDELLIGSPEFSSRDIVREQILQKFPDYFSLTKEWEKGVLEEKRDFSLTGFLKHIHFRDQLTLGEAGKMLLLHQCSQPTPPRIAVVFAGGGAKCSYQVGAIQAVEEALSSLRESTQQSAFDVNLVVGTSGGALNALPVALGISRSPKSRSLLGDVWQELDQRDIIRPSRRVRLLMVAWFVCLQTALLLRIRKERHFRNPEKYPWIISPYFIAFGVFQVLLARIPMKPWSFLGTNSLLHHFWLWLTWGLEGSGWLLIIVGFLSKCLRKFPKIADTPFPLRFRVVRRIAWIGILLIPFVQTVNILWYQTTLSDSVGIEQAIVKNFTSLIDGYLSSRDEPALHLPPAGTMNERLDSMGKEIVSRQLLQRDLVLTGSALPENTTEAAGDLYFYARGKDQKELLPRFGSRGVSLDLRTDLFMDVLIGSGAIFPVFPARTLNDFPVQGKRIDIVDGSFAHRSPVEAAVLWGATHILLIQAATDEVSQRGSFFDNLMASMNHLYDEAQLLDIRSREQAVTFTLTPRPPHIGLLDFSNNLIEYSIQKGYAEAKGIVENNVSVPNYRKEVSEPVFWNPPFLHGDQQFCKNLLL